MKTTLAWWSVPVWSAVVWVGWAVVLDPTHRAWLARQLPEIAAWAKELGAVGATIAIGVIVAHVMVHLIEVHDRIYDKHFVKWRRHYVTGFMIPRLLEPAGDRLPDDAVATAISNWKTCMNKLFYYFATDRDMRINKNLVVRFYERVTKYWLTQLTEVAILVLAIGIALYAALAPLLTSAGFSLRFVWQWVGLAIAFLIVRLLAVRLRASVREATAEEIDAIHSHAEFEGQLRAFCDEAGIALSA